jgi:hypothetical protein
MIHDELRALWENRRKDYARTRAMVSGEVIAEEVLHDLATLCQREDNEAITLQEASVWSGYSSRHIGRLIREGKLDNVGRPNAPRVRRGQLPMKPGRLTSARDPFILKSKAQIARSIVHPMRSNDG